MNRIRQFVAAIRAHPRFHLIVAGIIYLACLPVLLLEPRVPVGKRVLDYLIAVNVVWILVSAAWLSGAKSRLGSHGSAAIRWTVGMYFAVWLASLAWWTAWMRDDFGPVLDPQLAGPFTLFWFGISLFFVTFPALASLWVCPFLCRGRSGLSESPNVTLGAYWFAVSVTCGVPLLAGVAGKWFWQEIMAAAVVPAVWISTAIARRAAGPAEMGFRRVEGTVLRLLTPSVRGGQRKLDLRGCALGLLSGCLAALVPALIPAISGFALAGGMYAAGGFPGGLNSRVSGDAHVVLLTMDATTRYDAEVRRSEAAVQADVIRKLAGMHTTRIVIFPPYFQPKPARSPQEPKFDSAECRAVSDANRRDLGELLSAIRAAGNVTIDLSRIDRDLADPPEVPEALKRAAKECSYNWVGPRSAGATPLLCLPGKGKPTPVPLLLCAAQRHVALPAIAPADLADSAAFRKLHVRTLSARNAVTVFESAWMPADSLTPRMAIQDLLHGPVAHTQWPHSAHTERPLHAEKFLRNRIVFVEPDRTVSDPSMPFGRDALVAANAATRSVILDQGFQDLPRIVNSLLTILFGIAVGTICFRLSPIFASSLTVLLVLSFGIGVAWAMMNQIWIDPSGPVLAAALGFLFAMQAGSGRRSRSPENLLLPIATGRSLQ